MALKFIRELGVKVALAFDKKGAEEAKSKIEEVAETMKHTALRVTEVTAALFGFTKAASSNARELSEYSEQLGINVERLQELEYAAKVTAHVSREELMGSLKGVSTALYEARTGNVDALAAIDRLNLGMDVLGDTTITADKVLLKLGDGLKNIQNPLTRMAVLTKLGVDPKLMPALLLGSKGIADMGKEARNLGVILDRDAIEEGKKFDQQLSKLWIILKNVTYVIGHELIRYFKPLVQQWMMLVVQNKKLIASGIAVFMKSLSNYILIVFKAVKFLVERLKFLVDILGGIEKATKLVAIAMGIFTAVQLVSGLGKIITAFKSFAAVMGLLDIEAIIVAAGLLALILVVQDLFSDDSIIKEWFKIFEEKFPNLGKFAVGAFDIVKEAVLDTVEAIKVLVGWVESAFSGIAGIAGKIGGAFSSIANSSVMKAIGGGIGAAGDFLSGRAQQAGASREANTAASAATAANNSNQQNNQMTANITVQVPHGTSAATASKIVSGGVSDAFDSMMRNTKNQATGGVAY